MNKLEPSVKHGVVTGLAVGLAAVAMPLLIGKVIAGSGIYLCSNDEDRENLLQQTKTTIIGLKEHPRESLDQLVVRAQIGFESR